MGARGLGRRARSARVARGARAWTRDGIPLVDLIPPDGDPDRLLADPACHVVKDQRKVRVGVLERALSYRGTEPISAVYIKRYNVPSWRMRLMSLVQASPAARAWIAAATLTQAGFGVAPALAAVEYRQRGMLERCFFVTARVDDAVPADQFWWGLRGASTAARRRFAEALGQLFARLHAAGVYHNDLKDANLLVRRAADGTLAFYLLDLERVRRPYVLSMRRRVKNLAQLHRTLGRLASTRANLYFLREYLGAEAGDPARRRRWRRRVCRAARWKDLRHAVRGVS